MLGWGTIVSGYVFHLLVYERCVASLAFLRASASACVCVKKRERKRGIERERER
jgi:hypothetical protein